VIDDARRAIDYATDRGVVVIAAAGNEFFPLCDEPAFSADAICVIATTVEETKATYSNFNLNGGPFNVVRARVGPLSSLVRRTSSPPFRAGLEASAPKTSAHRATISTRAHMATPRVAGIAALLTAQGRSRANVARVLKSTARTPPLNTRGTYTPAYGFGIVDAKAAVAAPR